MTYVWHRHVAKNGSWILHEWSCPEFQWVLSRRNLKIKTIFCLHVLLCYNFCIVGCDWHAWHTGSELWIVNSTSVCTSCIYQRVSPRLNPSAWSHLLSCCRMCHTVCYCMKFGDLVASDANTYDVQRNFWCIDALISSLSSSSPSSSSLPNAAKYLCIHAVTPS